MRPTAIASLLTVLGSFGLFGGVAFAQQQLFHQPQSVSLQTASGMLLGVYANTTPEGLKIVGTIPGYSAEGRLFAGDILTQATASGMPVFSIRSHSEMEYAKSQIGPFREAAVEFFRPGVGLMYAWVTFKPIGGGTQPHLHGAPPVFGGGVALGGAGGTSGFSPDPFVNPNSGSPNNIVMKSEIGNPNTIEPRSANPGAGPSLNPNNTVPFSGGLPGSPNNTTARSEIGGPATSGPGRFKAEFLLESEKPGARLLFKRGRRSESTTPQTQFEAPLTLPKTNLPQTTLPRTGLPQGGLPKSLAPTSESTDTAPLQQRVQEFKRQQRLRTFGR